MRIHAFPGNRSIAGLLAAGLLMLAAASAAQAQALLDRTYDLDIPPQQLTSAMISLSRQTGIEVLMSAETVEGMQTTGVIGELSLRQALDDLLAGHPLDYRVTGDRAVSIAAASLDSAAGQNTIGQRRPGIEEIIVTGQKREERIQDVPIAISAFSPEDLEAQKIEGGFDLLKGVPNVTFSKTNFSGYNFQIRGIGTQAISATTDPGVAVSFNNTTLIVNRLFEQEYLDVERVEVLRGPQGTLFGRNATGGVINVITNKPELGVWDGMIDIEVGNYNTRRLRGFFNAPIGDELAVRGAYASTIRDGYGHNEFSEIDDDPFRDRVQADVDDRDLWTGRLSLGWQPNDRFRMNLIWERFEEDDRRVRTSKQLCTRDTGTVLDVADDDDPGVVIRQTNAETFPESYLSQGCKNGSLYSDEAFGTPNGASLPFMTGFYWANAFGATGITRFGGGSEVFGLGGSPYMSTPDQPGLPGCEFFFGTPINPPCDSDVPAGEFGEPTPGFTPEVAAKCEATEATSEATSTGSTKRILFPVDICNPDVFRGLTQSRDLRTISSQLEPQYYATSDIYELSFDYELSDELLFSWQTVYAEDEFYATQDYNRFTAFPIWEDSSRACFIEAEGTLGGAGVPDCNSTEQFADGFYADLSPRPEGTPPGTPGVFCDPQLGCSDTLLIQDLSRAESEQFNQEIRLVSSFTGDWNFSLGANYTRFETVNDYFVFSNAFTHLLNFFPFNDPSSFGGRCVEDGLFCRYVDPHSIDEIIAGQGGDGHNYFRNGNPYKLRSTALFGELYWNATDTVKITAGLRFTWDEKRFTPLPSELLLADYREAPTNIPEGAGPEACLAFHTICTLAGSAPGGRGYLPEADIVQEWREPTGRLVVDWSPVLDFTDETMFYASFARGYKGGGANPPSVAEPQARFFAEASGGAVIPPTFEPEFVNAYEIGTKNTLFGGVLVLNGNAFYYDYTDYQVSKIVDRTALNENFDAEVWGLELESIFAPSLNWQFNMAIGYLQTEVGEGEQSIDLMDRIAGGNRHFAADPDDLGSNAETTSFPEGFSEWIRLQPDIKAASGCIAPRELVEAIFLFGDFGGAGYFCPNGNLLGGQSSSGTPYFNENGDPCHATTNTPECPRKSYDPAKDAPNGGQGFFKDLGGNELPNAPHFTFALGAQYGFDLTRDWRATARVDYYWQDQSYARIYNLEPYDRLKSWSNTNLSFWVNNPVNGITVEAYVKNAFDETPITGSFLNSDDSGLTTNVFTLDPRLIGVSVRKEF